MTSLDTFASSLRSHLAAVLGVIAPLPPLPVAGLDPDTAATVRGLRRKYRRNPGLFRQGLWLHRQGRSRAELEAMFDALTNYVWDPFTVPCDLSTPEERKEREKVIVALMLHECRPALDRQPALLAYILSDDA